MTLLELVKADKLTDSQIKRKVTAAAKAYVKAQGWKDVQCRSIRGTWHFDNCDNHWMTAAQILQAATGLEFSPLNSGMARLKKTS